MTMARALTGWRPVPEHGEHYVQPSPVDVVSLVGLVMIQLVTTRTLAVRGCGWDSRASAEAGEVVADLPATAFVSAVAALLPQLGSVGAVRWSDRAVGADRRLPGFPDMLAARVVVYRPANPDAKGADRAGARLS